MTTLRNPDCRDGKHRACAGNGWDETADHAAPCPCHCHGAAPGTAMQAKHLSGASIGKLIEWEVGRNLTTGDLQWSPAGTIAHITHGADRAELHVRWNEAATDLIDLTPDSWVRVTQVPA